MSKLKEFVWRAFEVTGNVDAYVLYKELDDSLRVSNHTLIAREEVAISNKIL